LEFGPIRFIFDRIRIRIPDQKDIIEIPDIMAKLGIGMHKIELMYKEI